MANNSKASVERTALLTLGRLPKALDVAEALSKAGWRVIIAEPFTWHLCRVSKYVTKSFAVTAPNTDQKQYIEDLLRIITDERVSLVVPISEEALHAALIEPNLPDDVTLFSPKQNEIRELHNKLEFNQCAKSYGLSVPQTYPLDTQKARDYAVLGDYIVKPACTCSGQGFSQHSQGEPLPTSQNNRQIIVQQQMKGALKSTFSMCHEGRVIGTVVYRAAMLSGSVAVAFERLDAETRIEDWVKTFVKKSEYSGFISFDMMEDEAGIPHAIECNPRATSGIHFVERSAIAKAIVEPQNIEKLSLRPERLMYQFFPCLTETQSVLFKRDQFFEKVKTMWHAKEVNFSWSDPLPVWLMTFTSWPILKRSILKGESFGEAATFDIAWYED